LCFAICLISKCVENISMDLSSINKLKAVLPSGSTCKGLSKFPHSQSGQYYRLLLRSESPGTVPVNLKASSYAEAIEDNTALKISDMPALADAEAQGSECEATFSDDSGGGDNHIKDARGSSSASSSSSAHHPAPGGGGGGVIMDGAVGSDMSSGKPSSDDGSSSGSSVAVGSEAGEVISDYDPPAFPMESDGIKITTDDHDHKLKELRSHLRLKASCICRGVHGSCFKRRGRGSTFEVNLGLWEPVCFLISWSRLGPAYPSSATHIRNCKPSDEQVLAVFLELEEKGILCRS
jgi:hypothetical protein